ncbi:MBL fold metallo-hydrolase [Micromonosporaceae bacterium Da 78-11]
MPLTHTLGPITVTALQDAEGPFPTPREEAFPDATAEQWAEADALDPAARTEAGQWWLRFRSFAIRAGDGPVTLVDAGIGPAGSMAADWAPLPGRLPAELAEAGIDPADVTAIVLTHLHNDHIGWAVPRDSPFTEARVIAQRADLVAYEASRDHARQHELLVEPLRREGRLQVLDGDLDLGGGVRIVATPGHTPGHQSVLVENGDDSLLITGDLLVHAVQLRHPDLAYSGDQDPALARGTRRRMLDLAGARGSVVAVSHLGVAFQAYS